MKAYMQQIDALQKEMRRTILDIDHQINALRKTTSSIAEINNYYTKVLGDLNQAFSEATDPLSKLDIAKQILAETNNKYTELIRQTQENAQIRIDALTEELEIVQAIADVNKQIKADLEAMKRSPLRARLTPGRRVAELRGDIAEAKAAFESAKPEDKAEAAEKLRQLYNQLLQLGEEVYQRPSRAFQEIYREVQHGLEGLDKSTSDAADRAEAIQKEIKQIQEDTKTEVEKLNKQWANDLEGLKPFLTKAYTDAATYLTGKLQDVIDEFDKKFPDSANAHKNIGDIDKTMKDLEAARKVREQKIDKLQEDEKTAIDEIKKEWVGKLEPLKKDLINGYIFGIAALITKFNEAFGPYGSVTKALGPGGGQYFLDMINKKLQEVKTATENATKEVTTAGARASVRAAVREARGILHREGPLTPRERQLVADIFREVGGLYNSMGLNGQVWFDNAANVENGKLGDQTIRSLLNQMISGLPKGAQHGALVTKDTLLRVGEKGLKEAVVPLEDPQARAMMMDLFYDIFSKLGGARGFVYGAQTEETAKQIVLNTTVNVAEAQHLNADDIAVLVDKRITRSLKFGQLREGTRTANLQGRVVRYG